MTKLEYIWIDGTEPTAQLRSKTKILKERTDVNELYQKHLGNKNDV